MDLDVCEIFEMRSFDRVDRSEELSGLMDRFLSEDEVFSKTYQAINYNILLFSNHTFFPGKMNSSISTIEIFKQGRAWPVY